jgi:uncharacterized membrane protein
MASIIQTVDVKVPVRVAYDQWTQFESFPAFMEGIEKVEQLDDRRLHWVASVGGRQQEWDAEITQQEPDMRVAWRSTNGAQNAGVVTFHRLDDETTRVTLQMDWEPAGLVEKVGDVLHLDDRRVKGDLERFKEFIEARGAATGAWRGRIDQAAVQGGPGTTSSGATGRRAGSVATAERTGEDGGVITS